MNNKILEYYNQNAEKFVASTVAVDFNEIQDIFIEKLSGKMCWILAVGQEEI